jgi:hypothetical protein
MFSALASFAHIRAQDIPQGVMPNKRQVVGTGVTTSSSVAPTTSADPTSADPTSADPTTSDEPTTQETTATTTADPTTSEQPATTTETTDEPVTSAGPTITGDDTTATSATQTSDQQPEETTSESTAATSEDASTSEEATGTTTSETSSTPTSQVAVTTTDSKGSTITSSIPASASSTPTSAVRTVTDEDDGDSVVVIGSSTFDPSTFASKTTITSAVVRESTEPYTPTTYFTEDGTVRSRVVTGDRIVSATEIATATIDPTLAKGGSGGSSSSMAPQTKAIIGGVVGGIGGAILIGGLAIVAWRLWGKKKREQAAAVDDFGMGTAGSPRDSLGREKQTSASSHAPTLSTSSYRNPNGVVNTASNF